MSRGFERVAVPEKHRTLPAMSRIFRRWLSLLLLMALLIGVSASTGASGTMGTRPYANYEPLRITYTPDLNSECSCSEVTITATTVSSKPSSVDRQLEVVFYIGGYYRASTAYRVQLTLPQGANSATTKMYVRQPHTYAHWMADVLENHRSIVFPDPVATQISFNQAVGQTVGGLDCCEITLPNQPDGTGLPYDYAVHGTKVTKLLIQNAPTDWRSYLRFGFVVWPFEMLESATEQQLEALSRYVLAGGTLFTFFVEPSKLVEVDQYLLQNKTDQADFRWMSMKDANNDWGSKRMHGGGQVFCLKSVPANLDSLARSSFIHPVNDVVYDSNLDSAWFWKSLVMTVGRTPVWTFSVIVILFAVLIGPGLLYFTNRARQRTLMLLLVPSFSAVLTLLILLYNVAREGFDTRGRIASLQFYDAHTGQGHAWSRQSYFSGAPPAQGLRFSNDCLLNPVDGNTRRYAYMSDPSRNVSAEIALDGQNQYLRRWLDPRSQQQVTVGHPLKDVRLPIQLKSMPESKLEVTNLTEAELPIIVLRGPDDLYYFVSPLPAGQTTELQPQGLVDVESLLYKQWRDWMPAAPPEIDLTLSRMSGTTRYWFGYSGRTFIEPLEKLLDSRSIMSHLSPYGYLIISKQSSNIETPFSAEVFAKEENFHLLIGTLPW